LSTRMTPSRKSQVMALPGARRAGGAETCVGGLVLFDLFREALDVKRGAGLGEFVH